MATHDDQPLRLTDESTRSRRNPWVWALILIGILAVLALGVYGVWYWVDSLGKDEGEEYWAKRVEQSGGILEWDEQGPYRTVRKVMFTSSPEHQPNGEALWSLQFLTNVKELVFRGTDFRGAGFFRQQSNLESLDLAETKVNNWALRAVAEHSNLQHLDLSGTKITGAGLSHLASLTNLRRLVLANTMITDHGLAHLKRIPSLQSVNLRGTEVTDAGVADLQKALPHLKIER